jgi:hypothetical protein
LHLHSLRGDSTHSNREHPKLGANLGAQTCPAAAATHAEWQHARLLQERRGLLRLASQRAARTPTAPGRPHCRTPHGPGRLGLGHRDPTGRADSEAASDSESDRLASLRVMLAGLRPRPEARPGHWAAQGASWPASFAPREAEVPLAVGCPLAPSSGSTYVVEAACHGSVPRGICGAGKQCRAHPLKTVTLRYGHEPICGAPGAVVPRKEARVGASRDPGGLLCHHEGRPRRLPGHSVREGRSASELLFHLVQLVVAIAMQACAVHPTTPSASTSSDSAVAARADGGLNCRGGGCARRAWLVLAPQTISSTLSAIRTTFIVCACVRTCVRAYVRAMYVRSNASAWNVNVVYVDA